MATAASVNTVTGYFDTILQRSGSEVSDAEINSFATALDSGALTADQIRNALIASDEGQDVQFVIRLYQSFFGRVPDEAGLNFQVDALRNGASITDIANGFAASDEFSTRFGSNEVTDAFIISVYTQVLGRVPSGDEVSFYRDSGFDTARIALAFSESPEFTQLTSSVTSNFLQAAALGTQTFEGPLVLGQTFTATLDADLATTGTQFDNLVGTGFADTFNAAAANFQTGDVINGAGGIDTLNLTVDAALAGTPTISNVERINVSNTSGGAVTIDSDIFGAEARQFTVQNSTAAVTLTDISATQSIAIAGTITNATFNYEAAATAGATDTANLSLIGATAGTVTIGSGIETVNLSGIGSITSLVASSATALNVVAGAAGITLTSTQAFATVDASASTGSVNATLTLSSSATDTATITGGANNDTFVLTNFGANDVLSGNGGFDTLSVAGADYSSSAAAAPFTDISSIERVTFTGTGATTLDGATFVNSGITNLLFNTDAADTINNAGSARTYEFGTANTGDATFTLNAASTVLNVDLLGGTTANPADADVGALTVNLAGSASVDAVATLNLTSAGVIGTDINNVGAVTLVAGSTINIDGSANLTVADLGNATNVNASAFTGNFVLSDGSTGVDTIIGGTGLNTISTGAGNDVITGGTGASATVPTGGYVNVIDAGAGADTITGGTGTNDITGGAGVDQIDISASTGSDLIHLNGIVSAANRDFITGFQAGANGDVIQIDASNTTAGTAASAPPVVTEIASGASATFLSTTDILELSFNVAGNGLQNANDGSALLAQVGSITASASSATGYIVAYQGGNAYLYYADAASTGGASTAAALEAADIHLVGVVNNVAVGSLTAANFDLA